MFPTPLRASDRVRFPVRRAALLPLVAALALAALTLPFLGGCGGKKSDDVVLATVGGRDITASYYEDRLVRLEENELPRGDDGVTLDTAQMEGKRKFLDALITKEVMSLTADKLGYPRDKDVVEARKSLLAYEAAAAYRNSLVDEPASRISNEELQEFYKRFGSSRKCRFVITNFLADAEAARELALTGADWDDVVRQYHDGEMVADGKFEITVPFGRYKANYERGVFDTPVGGVTPPIETDYGYWVLKVDEELPGKRPPLEEVEGQIVEITHKRKLALKLEQVLASLNEKYEFKIHDEALLRCYEGLPAEGGFFYPGTQEPKKKEDLAPLAVAPADMDLPFYEWKDKEGHHLFTLGDYKVKYDNMSVFQRPQKGEMLGGLRQKIAKDIEAALLRFESEAQGWYEDPDVLAKVNKSIDEMVVSRLYSETVEYDDKVPMAELEAYYEEHKDEFIAPESRSGLLVVCADADNAARAREAALAHEDWSGILDRFNVDKANGERGGRIENVAENAKGAGRDALYSIEPGEVSEPFALPDGRVVVVRLDSITPPHQLPLNEVLERIRDLIRAQREEAAFQAKLAEWEADLDIVKHEENLTAVRGWKELKDEKAAAEAAQAAG